MGKHQVWPPRRDLVPHRARWFNLNGTVGRSSGAGGCRSNRWARAYGSLTPCVLALGLKKKSSWGGCKHGPAAPPLPAGQLGAWEFRSADDGAILGGKPTPPDCAQFCAHHQTLLSVMSSPSLESLAGQGICGIPSQLVATRLSRWFFVRRVLRSSLHLMLSCPAANLRNACSASNGVRLEYLAQIIFSIHFSVIIHQDGVGKGMVNPDDEDTAV